MGLIIFINFQLLRRTGWVKRGVPNPEHVADHMYMMAVMTFFIQDDRNLNKER
jgi:putative hydrolase of HD superfamily